MRRFLIVQEVKGKLEITIYREMWYSASFSTLMGYSKKKRIIMQMDNGKGMIRDFAPSEKAKMLKKVRRNLK